MEKKMMKSNGAGSRSSVMKRWRFLSTAAVLLICCLAFVGAVGAADFNGYGTVDSPYEISTVDDLKKLATNVNAGNPYSGIYFKLLYPLNLNNEEWTPIGNKDHPFKGSFDGNSMEIQNLKISSGDYVGLFGHTPGGIALKNIYLNNVDITGGQYVGALVGNAYTVDSIKNCHIYGTIKLEGTHHVGGIAGSSYASPIKECSVIGDDTSYVKGTFKEIDSEGDKIGGLIGQSQEGSFVIEACHTNIAVSGTRSIGGLLGFASYGNSITDCSATGSVKLVYVDDTTYYETLAEKGRQITAGGLIGESNPSSSSKVSVTSSSSDSELDVDALFAQNNIQSMVSLGLLGGVRGDVANVEMSQSNYITSADTLQTLKDAGYAVLDVDGSVSPMLSGEGTTDSPFEISNVAELKSMRDAINSGSKISGDNNAEVDAKSACYKLTADINLGEETWVPISSFAGEFNGNEKTISNFHVDATNARGGFFNIIEAGEGERVHDLTLKEVTATVGDNRFGTLANSVKGIVNRVTVKDVTVTTTDTRAWVGGMCAFMDWPWMNDCTVENLVVDAEAGADLIGGFACILQKNSNMVFDNNDVNGFRVTITDTDSSGCGVGGFVGQTQRGWENPKVINSDITGIDITASGLVDVGGFIAWPGAHTIAENCHTEGKIDVTGVTSEDCFAGGFFGNLGWNADLGKMGHVVNDCSADVDIITKVAPAGGFVGSATNSNDASMYATFKNCAANGDVTSVEGGTADIGGFAGDADRGVYEDCEANGQVINKGVGYAGGFIGAFKEVTPKYDGRYPAGTRDYLVDVSTIEGCKGSASPELKMIGNTEGGVDVTETGTLYTITFDTDGGSPVDSLELKPGYSIPAIEDPSKEGYTFNWWEPSIPSAMPAENYLVKANWTANSYTVTFDYNGGISTQETLLVTFDSPYENLPNAEKAGHTFLYWKHEDGTEVTNETVVKTAKDHTLTAVWENNPEDDEQIIPPSGSGSGDGGHLSFPRTTENGGLVDFGSSKVVKAVYLPEGSSGSVLLKVDTVEKWPKALDTEYTFDISVEKLGDGMAYIHFEIPESTLESLELTPADICAYHFEGEVWTKLPTTYEVKDGTVCYEAETDSFSPFKLVIEEGAAVPKEEETVPVIPPTEEPDVPDEPEILPPIDEPAKPTEPETPAPILAVLAGLGAAFIVRRK